MRTILAIFFIFLAVTVNAQTLADHNTQTDVTEYVFTNQPSFVPSRVPVVNGVLSLSLANYTEGVWTFQSSKCKGDPLFGRQCSVPKDYTLTCPSPTGGLTQTDLYIKP